MASPRGSISHPGWTSKSGLLGPEDDPGALLPGPPRDRLSHTGHTQEYPPSSTSTPHARCNRQSSLTTSDNVLTQERQPFLPSLRGNDDDQSSLHARTGSTHIAAPTQGDFDNHATPCSGFGQNTTFFQQAAPNIATAIPAAGLVALHEVDADALHAGSDDDTLSKEGLAMCGEIKFAPTTKRLLEDCKRNRGQFLRAIREAKVAFPTGQGWEAAIATKKENADIRDLMKIYHRFECHNIYSHVVGAGYHTGTHWIRDMRAILANKLYQDFPERFPNQKTANKSLNWVDQGCKYQEWAGMFCETPDLGYLIALPSEVSHSAYVPLNSKYRPQPATQSQMDIADTRPDAPKSK